MSNRLTYPWPEDITKHPRMEMREGVGSERIILYAHRTKWAPVGHESIALIEKRPDKLHQVRVWKSIPEISDEFWQPTGGPIEDLDQAVRYMLVLVQLGEADFTFLEEPCEPSMRD